MNQPSNPFFNETTLHDYVPDIAEAEQVMIDAAVLVEIQEGRLSGLLLRPEVAARVLNVASNDA